ncbi:MAG: transcription antitermination factor NusB [Clostridium sp.]|nr:transcription antitermination factor NusB [Clostridium sp.]
MKTRHELRYSAMIILYQIFLYESNDISFKIDDIISHQLDVKSDYVNSLVHGVIDNRDKIDELANKYLTDWDIYRLGFTDQAILRIAIYELMYTNTPYKVCIDEAIELSKKYSDDKVSKMINGVLDKIYHSKVNNEQ